MYVTTDFVNHKGQKFVVTRIISGGEPSSAHKTVLEQRGTVKYHKDAENIELHRERNRG